MPFYSNSHDNPNNGCRSCGSTEHHIKNCPALPCRYCHSNTHVIRDCPKTKQRRCRGVKDVNPDTYRAPSWKTERTITPKQKLIATSTTRSAQNTEDADTKALVCKQPVIVFPDLEGVFLSIMQYLQSNKPACGSFLDLAPYRDVIGLFASPEVLSRLLLDSVDPTIRALQNLTITRARLDEARATQIEGSQSWGQNSGYLDYVTDCRTPDYWRSYVGQSHNTPERITQHIREIRSGASHTLHYFVIKSGGGHRVANFMKLWTLVLPENFDPIIEDILTNLLEMAMARSFQSLPPDELDRVFGHPKDGSSFSFIGLNIISPLLQGTSLSPSARHRFSLQLKLSEDPDIQEYVGHRLEEQREKHTTRFPLFTKLNREECQKALRAASDAKPELRPYLKCFQSSDQQKSLEALETENDDYAWLTNQIESAELMPSSDDSTRHFLPVGCGNSHLGMILGEGAWGSSASGDGLIPKELRQHGFNESNVLLWTVGFRRLAGISPGVQVRFEDEPAELFRQLNFELISRSRVQVVIVCDKRAERIMFKNNPFIKPVTLQLQNRKVEAWVETRNEKRGCIYLSSPAPVVMLWSSSWAQVAKFSAILRFSVIIAGIQGIRTGACASQLATLQIIRQYDWERLGNVKMTPRTLDPNIRSWLDAKGFNDNDIERLGSCAKSLTAALLMLLKCQTQSKHGKNERLKVPNSQKRSHNKMDVEHLDNVRELWAEVCSRNPIAGSSHHISSMTVSARKTPVELDLVDGETINVQQELEKDRIESAAITVSGKIVKMHTCANIDFAYRSRKEARSMSMKRTSENLRTQMELLQGVHKAGVHFHSRNRLRTYATPWLPLYIMYRDFQKRFPDVSAVKKAIIKVEIKDNGEKHPQKWACDALESDPAGRLAFWVLLVVDEQQLGLYVTCEGDRAAKRANTFVDWMAGVSVEEIVRRPRRSVTFQINSPMIYTDDQGNVMPQAGKKGRQEPSE